MEAEPGRRRTRMPFHVTGGAREQGDAKVLHHAQEDALPARVCGFWQPVPFTRGRQDSDAASSSSTLTAASVRMPAASGVKGDVSISYPFFGYSSGVGIYPAHPPT